VRRATRFTLFFVPLFTVSKRYHVQCTNCGGVTDLTRQQAEHAQEWAARRG
jgi:Fe2+ or Zn2+ uptake regulation protein